MLLCLKKLFYFVFFFSLTIFADNIEKSDREEFLNYYLKGNLEKTISLGEEYIKKYPDSYFNSYIYYYIGKIYYNNKIYEKSFNFFKKCFFENKVGEIEIKEIFNNMYFGNNKYFSFNETYYFAKKAKQFEEDMEDEFIYFNISKDAGSILLIENFNRTQNKNKAKILSDYYYDKGDFFKGDIYLSYYENSDKTTSGALNLSLNKIRQYYEAAEGGMETGKYDIAKFYYKKIIAENIKQEQKNEAYFNLGKIAFFEKQYKEALDYYNIFLKIGDIRKNGEVYYNLANIYFELGDKEKTILYINKIFDEYPFTFWETKAKIMYSLKLKK